MAAIVIVAYYFDRRRSFATGISVCGSGVGTFVFAPLTQGGNSANSIGYKIGKECKMLEKIYRVVLLVG